MRSGTGGQGQVGGRGSGAGGLVQEGDVTKHVLLGYKVAGHYKIFSAL